MPPKKITSRTVLELQSGSPDSSELLKSPEGRRLVEQFARLVAAPELKMALRAGKKREEQQLIARFGHIRPSQQSAAVADAAPGLAAREIADAALDLTDRQRVIVHRVIRHYLSTGEPITMSALSRQLRLGRSTVRQHVAALRHKGHATHPAFARLT